MTTGGAAPLRFAADPATRAEAASLGAFRDPASVAVIGASNNQLKWGYWLARGALAGADRRAVYLVNRSAETVGGAPAFARLSDLPEVPELLVLCVPPRSIEGVVVEALQLGVKAFLGITAGTPDEARIAALIRAAGARLLGPNSLGLYDGSTKLQLAWGHFIPGPLAIISQSGQLGSEIANLGARCGLGVSRFISVGNQLDVTAGELLEDLIDHDATRIVALYLESFANGRQLVNILRALAETGKQTLLLTTGASEGSQRLARSHTGSITSALDTVDAACRAAGAIRVATPTELVHLAHYLSTAPRPMGRRIAVISDSGGQGGIAADEASARGLTTPVLSAQLQSTLAAVLPTGASVSNPVDLAGAGEANLSVYAELSQRILESGEVDAVVLSGYLGRYGEDTPTAEPAELRVIDRLGAIARGSRVPVVVHSMSEGSRAVGRMREHGIPAFTGIEFAMTAFAQASRLAEWPGRTIEDIDAESTVPEPGYWAARRFLTGIGVPLPAGVLIRSRAELDQASAALAFPVVLKAGWLEHKSEHDAVRLHLGSSRELAAVYDDMLARLGAGEYVVEEQDKRPNTVEMLVGGRLDPDFGPVIAVGAGGTEAELHRDVCVELAPVDRPTAVDMIRRLACFPLLNGWRGRPATDIDALAAIVVAVSEAIAAHTGLSEIEVNPVRVASDGALAVDALILPAAADPDSRRKP
ncbi:CoA-binding protein [Arthrobacter crusticola]|uniref:CoA-binding protein n=1 Tax=Arthrobacter crusticola TaxID=2547960 RepID=A0A4R5TZ96_9MICC|nr:acetate--CoA ligase family protein [Arthrobacter crusticola]TDK26599.1 CoA-binding protein [Arthrobacter crusticola]